MRVLITGGAGFIGSHVADRLLRRATRFAPSTALAQGLGVEARSEIRNEFRTGDIRHCFADVSRANELLSFSPAVSFEDGMGELVEWLAAQYADDRVIEAAAELAARGLTR
jgi:dTDP-L-rhamnose 4-epimerase